MRKEYKKGDKVVVRNDRWVNPQRGVAVQRSTSRETWVLVQLEGCEVAVWAHKANVRKEGE